MKDINNRQEFIEYLETHPETGTAYSNVMYDVPYYIPPHEFSRLETVAISFDQYANSLTYGVFKTYFHPETNEVFLGDMNDGGHLPQFCIIKIHREDLFTKSEALAQWYANRASKIWQQSAKRALPYGKEAVEYPVPGSEQSQMRQEPKEELPKEEAEAEKNATKPENLRYYLTALRRIIRPFLP